MEQEKSDDRVNMLLGKKENPALSKMLGKKISEENLLGNTKDQGNALNRMLGKEHTKSTYEKELTEKKVKCPKCGHEFEVE